MPVSQERAATGANTQGQVSGGSLSGNRSDTPQAEEPPVDDGDLRGLARVTREQTAYRAAGQALRRRNAELERYRIVVDNVDEYSIYTLDQDGRITSWEAGAQKLSGASEKQMLGRHYSTFFSDEEAAAGMPAHDLAEAARTGRYASDGWRITPKGLRVWSSGVLSALRDENGKLTGYLRIAHTLTSQKEAEDALRSLNAQLDRYRQTVDELRSRNNEVEAQARTAERDLEEKKLMLHEIHHRVKNNLQVVQSLLKMSVRTLPAGEARTVTMNTAQRVHAMAMVHERLYQTKDLAGISASTYIGDLFAGVSDSNAVPAGQILLHLEADEILLNLEQAMPFGLLVNELLSNCFKHAFCERRKGTIHVTLRRVSEAARLVVEDDGAGLPECFDPAKCKSLGLKLAASLARQLGGELTFASDHGCRVEAILTRLSGDPFSAAQSKA